MQCVTKKQEKQEKVISFHTIPKKGWEEETKNMDTKGHKSDVSILGGIHVKVLEYLFYGYLIDHILYWMRKRKQMRQTQI